MNPEQLVAPPDPFGLPAPTLLFVFLMNLTLVLHFIAMGYVLTTTLLHVPLALGARLGNVAHWVLRRTEGPLPVALSFTITLGVAPLLFVQALYQPVFYTANILIGYQWFGIVFVLMLGFYMIYVVYGGRAFGRWQLPPPVHALGRLIISLTILYMLVTMTANALLSLHPEKWQAVRESGGNFLAMDESIFAPRVLHNLFAALIIGGVWMIALGRRSLRVETDDIPRNGARHLLKLGAMIAGVGTMLQVMIGLWLFVMEIDAVQDMLFSARPAATLWMISLLFVLALMVLSFMAPLVDRPWLTWALWASLVGVLAGMFAAREASRQLHLQEYFTLESWEINPQLSSLALFLFLFVAALATLAVMIRWMTQDWRSNNPPPGEDPS